MLGRRNLGKKMGGVSVLGPACEGLPLYRETYVDFANLTIALTKPTQTTFTRQSRRFPYDLNLAEDREFPTTKRHHHSSITNPPIVQPAAKNKKRADKGQEARNE
jgi:hypothetical protein